MRKIHGQTTLSVQFFVACIQLTCSYENKRYPELVEEAVKFKLQFENADLIAGEALCVETLHQQN